MTSDAISTREAERDGRVEDLAVESLPGADLPGLIEVTAHPVPELRRDAETLVPLSRARDGGGRDGGGRDGRALALLRRARTGLDWRRLPGLRPREDVVPLSPAALLLRRFSLFVLLPTAMVAVYLFLIATDQYVAQAQFAVRGNVEPMAEASVGEFTNLIQKHNSQDSFIVRDFIRSRTMAETAERALGVTAMFSRREIDFWARYDSGQPVEELVKYWREHVVAQIESLSGVITLSVRAFTPEDAVAIAREVIARSEALVNDISRRAQADMVAGAERDAAQAEERLKAARQALQRFRNTWGIIDPVKSAETTLTTIAGLRKDKLKAENDLRVLRGSNLDEKARPVQVLVATVAATDAQIKQLQDGLTAEGFGGGAQTSITQALLEFEGLKIEQMIAEKLTESLHLLLEKARIAAAKQHIYLATFVPPDQPATATYPERGSALFIAFFCFLVAWSVVSLIAAGIKDARL